MLSDKVRGIKYSSALKPDRNLIISDYYLIYIDSGVLSNVPSVINYDNALREINSVISLSDFLPPEHHNFDINPPITEF